MKSKPLSRMLVIAMPLWLVACSNEPAVNLAIHDTKYVAIDATGMEITDAGGPAAGRQAPCVLDRYTGLMWEAKSDDGGLHDPSHTYSWYEPNEANEPDGVDYRGLANGGACQGSDCDTWSYVKKVNEAGHCGFNDWRVPLRDELASISDPRKTKSPPTTNTNFFPHAQPIDYWSSNDYHFQFDAAWVWDFQYGHDRVEWKKTPRPVRLVRGEALQLARVKD